MIVTDTFTQFGRRMASTEGGPYIVIADTPNPIRQLEPDALRVRADKMMPVIIEGLTTPAGEIERRMAGIARGQIRPQGVVRSSVPV
jgi:hypothetical protein